MPETVLPTPETVPPLNLALILDAGPPWIDKLEKALIFVPFLGWFIAAGTWKHRMAPVRKIYFNQLKSRPENALDAWQDGEERRVAKVVCENLKLQMGWPNERFVPWDPLDVAFWSYEDGLDAELAIDGIEDDLGVEKFTQIELDSLSGKQLGEYVRQLIEQPPRLKEPGRGKWSLWKKPEPKP